MADTPQTGKVNTAFSLPTRTFYGAGDEICQVRLGRTRLHPGSWKADVRESRPGALAALGSEVLTHIGNAVATSPIRVVRFALPANDPAVPILSACGFRMIMRTDCGRIFPGQIPMSAHPALPARITTLREMPELFEDVAAFHMEIYGAQHAEWNPAVPSTLEQNIHRFLDPAELDPSTQYLAFQDDALVGVSSLRFPIGPHAADLGWIGVAADPALPADETHRQLLDACFDEARTRNLPLTVEVDQSDSLTWEALHQLPVAWNETLVHLVRDYAHDN